MSTELWTVHWQEKPLKYDGGSGGGDGSGEIINTRRQCALVDEQLCGECVSVGQRGMNGPTFLKDSCSVKESG